MAGSNLHADDTPVLVLAPAVWFAYAPDRKDERPLEHLRHYRGALQADTYSGFGHLYDLPPANSASLIWSSLVM